MDSVRLADYNKNRMAAGGFSGCNGFSVQDRPCTMTFHEKLISLISYRPYKNKKFATKNKLCD